MPSLTDPPRKWCDSCWENRLTGKQQRYCCEACKRKANLRAWAASWARRHRVQVRHPRVLIQLGDPCKRGHVGQRRYRWQWSTRRGQKIQAVVCDGCRATDNHGQLRTERTAVVLSLACQYGLHPECQACNCRCHLG